MLVSNVRSLNALIVVSGMVIAVLLGGLDARAQETGAEPDREEAVASGREGRAQARTLDLDAIVVTPSRTEGVIVDEPYNVDVLTGEDMEETLERTVPESLQREPSVMVQKTGHGQGSPYIRGFTSLQNLFLIDGFRLNNSVFRPGPNQYWNTIDPYSIQRLELVRGPGSVLYGSDAIGGTVNAITISPLDSADDIFGGRLLYRTSTAENSHIGRGEFIGVVEDRFGYAIGFTGKHFGDLVGGDEVGLQEDTGYDEYDIDTKFEYQIDADTRLIAAYQRVRQNNAPRTHRTIHAIDWEDLSVGSELQRDLDQERDFAYLKLIRDNLNDFIDRATVGVSWHEQTEVRHRIRTRGHDFQGFYVGQIGAMAEFETQTKFGRFVYGFDYYHDNVNSFASNNPIQGPIADDATYDLLGVYIQDTIPFLDDRLELTLGGRFTYAAADADSVQDPNTGEKIGIDEDWNSVVGNARLLWHVDPEYHHHLYVGVSQGFRTPNLSDLTRFDTARSDEFETPATDLDPEYFITYEGGYKAQFANFSGEVAYFYTDINDMIIRFPTGDVIDGNSEVTKDNVGDGYVHGVEISGRYRFHPQWTVFAGGSWLYGAVDTYPTSAQELEREPLDRLMPPTGHLGLRWEHPREELWVEGILDVADEADKLSTRDQGDTSRIPPGGTPGYEVLSFYAGWEPWEFAAITVGFENVFDEDYRIHGSGINEPGRNFTAQFEYRF